MKETVVSLSTITYNNVPYIAQFVKDHLDE
jgi:hypothetical protein